MELSYNGVNGPPAQEHAEYQCRVEHEAAQLPQMVANHVKDPEQKLEHVVIQSAVHHSGLIGVHAL